MLPCINTWISSLPVSYHCISSQIVVSFWRRKDTFGRWRQCWTLLVWWLFSRSVVSNSFDPVDCRPPVSSVHGLLQSRILKWVVISFSRDLPHPGIEPGSPALQTGSLLSEPPGKLPSCILNHNWKWHQEAPPSTTITEIQACILERLERWVLIFRDWELGAKARWGLVVAGGRAWNKKTGF